MEAVLFVVGLAAQFFLWLYVEALEARAALLLAMLAHFGIAAVRSRTVGAVASVPTDDMEAEAQDDESGEDRPVDERPTVFPSTLTRAASELRWQDIEAMPSLEANAALRQHNGDKQAYLQALRRFAQLYKGGIAQWSGWLDRGRWDDLERAVQALHGHAGSIGALRVQAGAGRLAMQCDSEDLLGGHAGLPALQDDLMQVLQPLLDAGLAEGHAAPRATAGVVPVGAASKRRH